MPRRAWNQGLSILVSTLALATLASPARAEGSPTKPEEESKIGGLIQGFSLVSLLSLDGRAFVGRAPYRAAGLRFQGAGTAIGGGIEMLLNVDRYRVGFDATVFTVRGVELAHVPLGPDLGASLSPPLGSDLAVAVGRELALGPVHPYLDLRLGVSFVKWSIDPHSVILGPLTSLGGTLVTPLLTPRLGVSFRLGRRVNLDVATTASPLGLARAGVFLGLGVYTDAFTSENGLGPRAAPEP